MTAVRLVVMRVWLHSRIIGSGVVPAQPGLLGGGPRRAGFLVRRRHAASHAAPLAGGDKLNLCAASRAAPLAPAKNLPAGGHALPPAASRGGDGSAEASPVIFRRDLAGATGASWWGSSARRLFVRRRRHAASRAAPLAPAKNLPAGGHAFPPAASSAGDGSAEASPVNIRRDRGRRDRGFVVGVLGAPAFLIVNRHAASRAAPLAPEIISPLAVTLSRRPRLVLVMVVRKRPR
jgi:hypothetical protein